MPITQYFNGFRFDPETTRVLGVAFEMTRAAIKLDGQDPIDEIIAKKIIELARAGERNPNHLCELALNDIRWRLGHFSKFPP
jgi:hypothetical protein